MERKPKREGTDFSDIRTRFEFQLYHLTVVEWT